MTILIYPTAGGVAGYLADLFLAAALWPQADPLGPLPSTLLGMIISMVIGWELGSQRAGLPT